MKTMWKVAAVAAAFSAGFVARGVVPGEPVVEAQSGRVFELRTYTAPEGKLEELHARFRDHTLQLFAKHHLTNIAYFRPTDAPLKDNTLIYLIAHPSREEAKKNWDEFNKDPEWQKVNTESQVNGRIVSKVESVFLEPAEYSPLK